MTRTHEELERRREQINKHLNLPDGWRWNYMDADKYGKTGVWDADDAPASVEVLRTHSENGVNRYTATLYHFEEAEKTELAEIDGLATGRAVASVVEHFMALVDDGHVEP